MCVGSSVEVTGELAGVGSGDLSAFIHGAFVLLSLTFMLVLEKELIS